MRKKTSVSLKIVPGTVPTLAQGDTFKRGDILFKSKPAEIDELHISQLLKISPTEISQYLVVEPGKEVKIGQVIAQKKGMFSQKQIKSPVSGSLTIVSEQKGIVGIEKVAAQEGKAPFSGEVYEIAGDELICTVEGEVTVCLGGRGKPVTGKAFMVSDEATSLTMPTEIEGTVLIVKEATSDMVAKADTLGAVAIVGEKVAEGTFSFPHVIVSSVDELREADKKPVVVLGDEKQLIVLAKSIGEKTEKTKVKSKKTK